MDSCVHKLIPAYTVNSEGNSFDDDWQYKHICLLERFRCWFGKRAGVYTDYIYQGPMILVLVVRVSFLFVLQHSAPLT